jgi:hypothetical protein
MSFFDDASLVMIPSGYKNQKVYSVKPTDGTGDLTFSRASSATRVQSDGLIEKVRTNLSLYSEQFDNAWWGASNVTITANNTTDPLGGSAAEKALCTAGTLSPNIFSTGVTCVSGVEYTASYYAKQGTSKYAKIRFSSTAFASSTNSPIFDLNAGTLVSGTGVITSVGNGWYRISATQTAEASAGGIFTIDIPSSTGVWPNGTFAGTEFIYIFGYQFEVNVSVSPYIATTTAAVSVGPVSGLPRLDYLGSTCPRLLLEPQRTNVIQFSDGLVVAQAFNGTLTKNNITSPDGYVNASLFTPTPNANAGITTTTITTSAISYTFSIYLKGSVAGQKVRFFGDLQNVTEFTLTTSFARYTTTFTGAVGAQSFYIGAGAYISPVQNNPFYLYGCQLEEGAYATSYIPTLGASVTRVADAASKTGISSLIGQTEGTLYWEGSGNAAVGGADLWMAAISVDDTNVAILLYYFASAGTVNAFINNGTTSVSLAAPMTLTQNNKLAVAYKNASFALYLNGALVASSSSAIAPPTAMNQFAFVKWVGASNQDRALVNQALLFKTRLTNSQLAELTS